MLGTAGNYTCCWGRRGCKTRARDLDILQTDDLTKLEFCSQRSRCEPMLVKRLDLLAQHAASDASKRQASSVFTPGRHSRQRRQDSAMSQAVALWGSCHHASR